MVAGAKHNIKRTDMNSNIKKLGDQVGLDLADDKIKKFAELIVEACAEIANDYVRNQWLRQEGQSLNHGTKSEIAARIQRHFGDKIA